MKFIVCKKCKRRICEDVKTEKGCMQCDYEWHRNKLKEKKYDKKD
jgi:hypothetical protein